MAKPILVKTHLSWFIFHEDVKGSKRAANWHIKNVTIWTDRTWSKKAVLQIYVKTGSLQRAHPHGCGQSRAVSAYIGQQGISACVSEAVLSGLRGFFPLWPLFQDQVQIPLADVNIDRGQGKFPSPASPSRGLSVYVPRRCVPGIYKHGL